MGEHAADRQTPPEHAPPSSTAEAVTHRGPGRGDASHAPALRYSLQYESMILFVPDVKW